MNIWTEPDSEDDPETWVDMTRDDLGLIESPTWKLEMYANIEGEKG